MEMLSQPTETPEASPEVPSGPGELCRRGRQRLRLFDPEGYEEAVACFREALALDPSHLPAYVGLAETYSYWGFRRELAGESSESCYELAYEYAERALQMDPAQGQAHRGMAVALRRGRKADPERRKAEALIAVELDPQDAENWYEYWRAFGYDPADEAIRKALQIDDSHFGAHHDLGVAFCEEGRLDEAVAHLLAALRINPRNTLAHYNMAMALQRKGLTSHAFEHLHSARRLCPEDPLIEAGLKHLKTEIHGA